MFLGHTKELICNPKLDFLRLSNVVLYLPELTGRARLTHSPQELARLGSLMLMHAISRKHCVMFRPKHVALVLSITVGPLTYRRASQSMLQEPPRN